jgi:hypothetical protein
MHWEFGAKSHNRGASYTVGITFLCHRGGAFTSARGEVAREAPILGRRRLIAERCVIWGNLGAFDRHNRR